MVLDDLRSCVERAPEAVAVADGDRRLTYAELLRHASVLAGDLTRRGVRADDVVVVYAHRSAEIVVAEVAAVLAGAAYLPMDPAQPAARTSELLALANPAAVVSTAALVAGGAPLGPDPLVVDLSAAPADVTPTWVTPHGASLAYVIYTSGSTGRPKGAMLTHAGLANLMGWYRRAFTPEPGERATLLCSPGFDVAAWEVWTTLSTGGTLVVTPPEVRVSASALVRWMADQRIARTFLPTVLAESVLAEDWPADTTLRLMHLGGSAMQRGVPPGLPFAVVNVYGPAEGTVSVTTGEVRPGDPVPPSIGVPLDGARVYVLDGLDPVPDGEPGELCLAGAGVGRGYLGNPAGSARVFVPDISVAGERMYRTGDKVRRRPDGSYEYIGRYDDQVKIRGFRVEPGEVAAVLRQHPAVRAAVVVAERAGHPDARLIGYVAADAAPADLLKFAGTRLPAYLVPAAVVVLDELPVTPNGKIDRDALPAPDRAAAGLDTLAAPHRTATEATLAAIMAELLGVGEVGANDDFFALGGNSLVVGRLASRVEAELHVAVNMPELLALRTVGAIADMVDQRAGVAAGPRGLAAAPPITPARRDGPVPLTLPQQRVWFFEQLSPGNLAYNFQATVSLNGSVDAGVLGAALDEIVRRHEVLRTAIVSVGGAGQQRLVPTPGAGLRVRDMPAEDAPEAIAAELRAPFDLNRPPLARYLLLRHGPERATFVLVEHHLVHDGWSFAVFLTELNILYRAYAAGQPSPLPDLAVQYADVAFWQHEWMRGEVLRAHVDHWTERLAGASHVLELPADRPRPPEMSFRGAAPRMPVPPELSRALRAFSREHRVSLFSTMYAGFAALLHRYTGQSDLLVGTGAANRSVPDIERMIGMFVNTLVLRTRVSGGMAFTELLDQAQRTVVDALAWSETPVDEVINAIGTARDPSRTPLFQVMFSFHDSAVPDLDFGGVTGAVTERANGSAKTDLNVIVIPRAAQRLGREPRPEDDDLSLVWEYSTDLFDEATMTRMVGHYLNLLADALARPEAGIDDLRLMGDDESRRVEAWSAGPAAGVVSDTIPARFAAQVRRDPDAIALVAGDTSMTYAELDRRANALARSLRDDGVTTDTPVAVAVERGPELVVALLAVLKAGGAYLPVDRGSPAPRVAAMIAAGRARLMLVTAATAAAMSGVAGVRLIHVDTETEAESGPPDVSHPLSLAYISFTSGSTGVPKGVAVPQRAVLRLVSDPTFAPLGPGQRLLHLAPVAFDASTLEIWGALLTGGTIVIAPPERPDVTSLLRTADATVVWLTAGLFHQIAEVDLDALASVPVLLSGGDVLNPDAVRAVLAARAGRPLVNGYGPTENTTFTTCHVMTDPDEVGPTVPIGRPIQHTTVHILDRAGHPVPVGVTGELYTGGDGLARGYAGNAAATARAFVPDPFGHGTRLYRTGDLARWRADGTVEFIGRGDDQIKIRGFRVEPGEVAAVLRAHPSVRDAVVLVAGDGAQRHLVGYLTAADGADPDTLRARELRDFLSGRLPEYLVPTAFMVLERLPLNVNGKVDRAALPPLDAPAPDTPFTPPQGPTEEKLADVWRLLLPADMARAVGREDSFFALGGNSLLATRLMFRIREAFGAEIGVAAFYKAPTLAACAAVIDAARPATGGGGADAPAAVAPASIGRRDRGAYRVADAPASSGGTPHRTPPPSGGSPQPAPAPSGGSPQPAPASSGGTAQPAPASSGGSPQPAPAPRGGGPAGTRQSALAPAGASVATAPPPASIGRRDRSTYRVAEPAPGDAATLAPHLVRLTDDWALWHWVCLRAAGFPLRLLSALSDTALAEAAEAVLANSGRKADPEAKERAATAYAAEFAAAIRRQSAALHEAASQPALREAVAWQNRHALATGIDSLVRHGTEPGRRNGQHRQHEALVASYLQRYCAKNDTIGFFGPVGWSRIDDGPGIRTTHPEAGRELASRTTYLEGWGVRAIAAEHAMALRPWLVPRRMPFVGLDGNRLRLPLAPSVPLTPAELAVLHACDGTRDATEVAAVVLADPATGLRDVEAVFALLARLADSRRLAWQVDVSPQDIHPEKSVRALLSRVTDDGVRVPVEKALDEFIAARDELSAAAGDTDRVAAAMAGLEETFTRLSGRPATRRAGELYAGRTLAFEECLRGGDVRLGASTLDGVRDALALVLDGARWFTVACGSAYARHFREIHAQRAAELGTDVVPMADFWLMANDALFADAPRLVEDVVADLRRRWSAVLDLPADGGRRVHLRSADLAARVAEHFPVQPLCWPTSVHHSPDLMIAADGDGKLTWVLGEVHPGVITLRYATWLAFHDDPAGIRAAIRRDLGVSGVWLAETSEIGGSATRLSNAVASPGDLRLVFAHDSCGYDPATTLVVGECDVVDSPTGLRVRRRDGTVERDLGAVVGDLIGAMLANRYDLAPRGDHAPRVTIDELVVNRERWTFPAAALAFADIRDESVRYVQARAWAARHGLPRYVFARFTGERKPIYGDLTSLSSIDLICRSARRARRDAGDAATVTVVEMLPTPDQAWLTDAEGQHYTAELRMVAADQKSAYRLKKG